jgi:molybdate transport system substrate-binding protein
MRTLIGGLLVSMTLAVPAPAAEVRLSVAASMTNVTKELIATYEKQAPGAAFLPNFASSGSLAMQILRGAPADIFISANPRWMNYLVEENLIAADQFRTFAYNSLVFVGKDVLSITSLDDVARLQRIAIGSPKSVPAGQYAEQALKRAGLYDLVQGKLVLAKDVRQALIYADRGETDGAFVYKTDALLAREAVILIEVPEALYSEVSYPVGLTAAGVANPAAVAFYDYLSSSEATDILKKFGFVVK